MPKKKPKYEEVSEHEVFTFSPHMRVKKFFRCPRHDYIFVEGCVCPKCESPRRSIFAEWEPSQDTQLVEEEEHPAFFDVLKIEKDLPVGTFKVVKCSLHNLPYVEGLNECPECKCWAS